MNVTPKWRFWDTLDRVMLYDEPPGLGDDQTRRFIAMRLVSQSSAGAAAVYAGDLLKRHGGTESFLALSNGTVEGEHKNRFPLAEIAPYEIIGHDHDLK